MNVNFRNTNDIQSPLNNFNSPISEWSRPPSPTHSVAATAVTHWTNLPPSPDMSQVGDALNSMRQAMESLGMTFESLGQQSNKIAGIGHDFDHSGQLASLERHMAQNDRKQEKRMEDVRKLLGTVVPNEIIPYLNDIIDDEIATQMDDLIQEQVSAQLEHEIPLRLQEEILAHKKELEKVKISLHNSEARRANALVRSSYLSDPLHPLMKSDGTISKRFPSNLTALLALDGPGSQELSLEYGLPDLGNTREKNINRFMQFCGVAYQITMVDLAEPVRTLPGAWVEDNVDDVDAEPLKTKATTQVPRDAFGVQFLGSLLAATGQLTMLYFAAGGTLA